MDNKVIWRLWKIAFKLPNWWLKVNCYTDQFSSVAQSCLTLCDPMDCSTPREPCPSPTPGTCSNSCPASRWCHPTISSSVVIFSSHSQSFPALGSFPMSRFFTSGGQSIGVSASALVLPMNIQGWFPLGLTGLISLQSKRLSRVFSNTFGTQSSQQSNSHIHTLLLEKPSLWLDRPLLAKQYLCFLICCLGCHCFSSREQVSFNFMAAVIICNDFGAQENKVSHYFHCLPI